MNFQKAKQKKKRLRKNSLQNMVLSRTQKKKKKIAAEF